MSEISTVIFSYRVDDILEELTKRTSYLGKMRSTENEPFLIDRLSLTSGEGFMFSEFLEDAVSETYNFVKAFGRCIPQYDKIVLKYEDIKIYEKIYARMTIGGVEKAIGEKTKVDITEFVPENANELYVQHDVGLVVANAFTEPIDVTIDHTLVLHTMLNGKRVSKTIEYTRTHRLTNEMEEYTFDGDYVPFNFNEEGGTHEIVGGELYITVNARPVNFKPIKHGTYVEHHNNLNNPDDYIVYKTNIDCTTLDWLENSCKLAVDPRGCIIFILERTNHMDINLMHSVDRNIKEALINYIIYKWFEYTNVAEADKFWLKFDDYARKAQLGMNSETKILQRNYKLF